MSRMKLTLGQAEIINELTEILGCKPEELVEVVTELSELYLPRKIFNINRNEFGFPSQIQKK